MRYASILRFLMTLTHFLQMIRYVQSGESFTYRGSVAPLQHLELTHTKWVSLVILPFFALANMGLVFKGIDLSEAISHPVTLGIGFGLVIGKTSGVFVATFLASKLMRLPLAEGFTWLRLLGVAFLGGIGFTMSLFISSLSYEKPIYLDYAKIGIICGSVLCALLGYFILRISTEAGKRGA